MIRYVPPAVILGLIAAASVQAGPVTGPTARQERLLPASGQPFAVEFKLKFVGGQRACVIVRGDHKPPVPLEIAIFDKDSKLVATDKSDKDFLAVFWVPARTAEYRIVVRNHGEEEYATYPENEKFTDVWITVR